MEQTTLADNGFALATKKTRKRVFLEEMNGVVPWARLVAVIQGYAPMAKSGRPPFPIEVMLRIHFLELWNNCSDPAMEEALHDMPVYCSFVGLDAGASRLPDESTILRFRHFLEEFGLAKVILSEVNATLQSKGLLLKNGTAIDATLIAAPTSTKSDSGTRDPQMHQTKKGDQYYFGMKAHIGVDANSGLTHTLVSTAANVSDIIQAHALLHGDDTKAFGDAGYQGVERRQENEKSAGTWHVALRPVSAVRCAIRKQDGCASNAKSSRPVFERRLSIRFTSSRTSLDTRRRANAEWQRTPRGCIRSSVWRI